MANILFVKANDRPAEQAVSVQMYDAFLNAYKESNPNDTVTELDLYEDQIPHFGNDAMTGNFKLANGMELTADEQNAAATAARYLDQFLAADKVVLAFPLWNFTAPSPMISYISHLAQAGKTFKYTAEGPVGLVGDKKVALLSARGGVYSVEPMSTIESAITPIKATLGLFGIQVEEVIIEGHNQFKDRSAEIVAEGLKEAAATAAGF
ncbi:FMN-dependent NADH-azoreductase [Paenibacillus sp. LHD-117]|uniref:FMN-dependent NADH-azoreductase n=1 Tax=Paenibacillus sp. LHD-117 TaxID=3071412 RepID=UPI0027E03B0B|nr:FMN-dependent NADH-azoreductase [Paenibacillus sp. LHD-117]MDQ6419032.1 FMN-dependent NADH-azoreductase [Paenibacillus sp. LHD-117]